MADLASRERISFGEALRRVDEIPGLAARSANQLTSFADLLDAHEAMVGRAVPADAMLTSVLEQSGYLAELQGSDDPQDGTRLENLIELVTRGPRVRRAAWRCCRRGLDADGLGGRAPLRPAAARRRPARPPGPADGDVDPEADLAAGAAEPDASLGAFLERVALVADSDQIPADPTPRSGVVTLMTLHTAKGLEFDGRLPDRVRGRGLPAPAGAAATPTSWPRSAGWPTSASPGRASGCTSPGRSCGRRGAARSTTRRAGSWPRSRTGWCDWRRTERAVTQLAEHVGDLAGAAGLADRVGYGAAPAEGPARSQRSAAGDRVLHADVRHGQGAGHVGQRRRHQGRRRLRLRPGSSGSSLKHAPLEKL